MSENVLTRDVQHVQGISPKRGDVLEKAGVRTFWDLLHFYPRRYLDRSTIVPIRTLDESMGAVTLSADYYHQDANTSVNSNTAKFRKLRKKCGLRRNGLKN